MKYKNAYKLNISKLKQYIKASKKTKLQIANDANTTDRTLRRALNGDNISLITIQNLARIFNTQINNLIKDSSFDIDRPPVLFQRITDVRETLNDIYINHQYNWNDTTEYYPNIYYHYDLRLNDNIIKKIDYLSKLFKSDHQKKLKALKEVNKSKNEYLYKQNYYLQQVSKGNTCIDDLAKDAHVYIGNYKYVSIKEFKKYIYTNNTREENGYYLSPYRKTMTLILFSEKKFEQVVLYPDLGFSLKRMNEEFLKLVEDKDRKANKKECKNLLKEWLDDVPDYQTEQREVWMEDNDYFPDCIEDYRQDLYELAFPEFDINTDRYRGDIIPIESPSIKKKEDDM